MSAYHLNQAGWLNQAEQLVSPNTDARPEGSTIDMIVVHNISLPPNQYGGDGIAQLFTNQLDPNAHPYYAEIHTLTVSSHFLIRRDGKLMQFVSCLDRAWHAGKSHWQGRERCNDFSVGIELEGCDSEAFESVQYTVLNQLIDTLTQSYPIQHIIGHSDIAPGRKTDPGPYFNWAKVKAETIHNTPCKN